MLQSGGGNNSTSALLKEYFSSEKACQLNALNNSGKYRGSAGGILPCPTPYTDLNSMKKATSVAKAQSPRYASPRNTTPRSVPKPPTLPPITKPLEESMNSSRQSSQVVSPRVHSKAPAGRGDTSPRIHSHGKSPSYGRRNVEKEFYDTVSTGHIPCLSLPTN
jgi:hypothetical protein